MGKTGIEVQEAPGFVVNRILVPMIIEAVFVLQEGLASASEIDDGMKLGANHPMGPLALADLVGLDTLLSVQQHLYKNSVQPEYRVPGLQRRWCGQDVWAASPARGFTITVDRTLS
jgi:3-hydroxybutyryl-CoA dehydrogenase